MSVPKRHFNNNNNKKETTEIQKYFVVAVALLNKRLNMLYTGLQNRKEIEQINDKPTVNPEIITEQITFEKMR